MENQAATYRPHRCKEMCSSHLTPLATYDECWTCHQIFNYRYRKFWDRLKALFTKWGNDNPRKGIL